MYRFAFATLLTLPLAVGTGCPEETPPAKSRVADIVTSLTPGQGWEALSAEDQAYLEDRAAETLADFRARWGKEGLATKADTILGTAPGSAAMNAFDDAFRVRFRSRLPDPDAFNASEAISDTALRSLLIQLHLIHLGARRINAVRYDGVPNVDWDGSGPIREFPLPDQQAMADQREFASTVEQGLLALDTSGMDAVTLSIRDRALLYARQLATGATGFRFGGRDYETVWGVAQWSWDLMCNYSDDCFGKVWNNDEAFLDAVNAWFFGPLRWIDKGAMVGLDFAIASSEDWTEVSRLLGNPDQTPTALAYLRLVDLWQQRVRASAEASADCTVYTPADRDLAWRSFTAENLLYPELDGGLADLGSDVDAFLDSLREQQKGFVIAIVEKMRDDGETQQATVDAVASQLAQVQGGSLQFLLNVGYSALSSVDAGAADLFKTRLETLQTIGGGGDETIFQQMWDQVTEWVVNRFYNGAATNPATGKPYLPEDIVINPSGGALTSADGQVSIGISGTYPPTTYYRAMLHEAHHSVLAREGAFPEGASWEGAALNVEMQLLPEFLQDIWAGDPTFDGMAPYYLAGEWVGYQYLMAGSEATLGSWLRDSCEPDATTYVSETATEWGLNPDLVTPLTERVYQGLNYLQYVAEGVSYKTAMEALDARLGPEQQLDPYTIIACGVGLLDDTPQTAQQLADCLGVSL